MTDPAYAELNRSKRVCSAGLELWALVIRSVILEMVESALILSTRTTILPSIFFAPAGTLMPFDTLMGRLSPVR